MEEENPKIEQFNIMEPSINNEDSSDNERKNFDINNPSPPSTSKEKKSNEEEENKKKSWFKFPTAYTIIVILEVIVFILTYIIPKGRFAKLEYLDDEFYVTYPNDTGRSFPAIEETLKNLSIKIPLSNFENGNIKKAIAIPNTYERIDVDQIDFFQLFVFPIYGLIESSDISFFLLILGGCINVLNEMNSFSSGMAALSRITKGRQFILLSLVYILVSIGGTTFGMAEEILAFYPILMPIFLKNGIDGMLGAASLFMGSCIGTMFSTVNAFAVVIASDSAGINFKDGIAFRVINFILADALTILYFFRYYRKVKLSEEFSIVYELKKELEDKYLTEEKGDDENQLNNEEKKNKNDEFTLMQKISLILFLTSFIIMIIGVIALDWWFEYMTATFFTCGIILMFLLRKGEEKSIQVFIKGAGDFCGVALIVGLARGINITLETGDINDTILNSLSKSVDGLPKIIFAILMLIMFVFLGFFISSSSGLAVLSMPVFAPLADEVDINRSVVINAYMFGQNFIQIIAPSGLILIVLQLVGIKFNHWVKLFGHI